MKKVKAFLTSTYFAIPIISIIVVGGYFLSLFLLNEKKLTENAFGDYIGGVMNPLLTLLSTLSIIFLTYFIAKRDRNQVSETISTQRRLTLNQMRNDALNELSSRLNKFAHEIDSMNIAQESSSKFAMKVKVHQNKKERIDNNLEGPKNIWFGILFELDSFRHKKYLFETLFTSQDYIDANESLNDAVEKLASEQKSDEYITMKSIENYLNQQSEFLNILGDYILKEF